jgi:predicted dehydrogenase
VLVGIGGMGQVYVRELLRREGEGLFRIAGAVDPQPNRCEQYKELRALGVPCFVSLTDFARNKKAELAVISSPIQFHREQTCLALERGSHVLCEKPAAGTIQDVRAMMTAERGSRRWAAVGYQWSFSRAVQALKGDIRSGLFGRPKRMKCLYLWPRDEGYYARNDWAGRRRDAGGRWVLDSPAQNAMAHDLHNMLYVLGAGPEAGAVPAEVEAELYRAYPIENFDTAAARIVTAEGVEILFYVTHVAEAERGPVFRYEFERGVVRCESRASGVWAELADGSRRDYGLPDDEPMNKLWRSVAGVRDGTRPLCGLEAAAGQTLVINGMQDSMPEIRGFPEALVRAVGEEGSRRLVVAGLGEALAAAYEAGALPSEMGVGWSAKGERIDLRSYASFPSA